MFAAFDRAVQYVGRLTVPIEAKETENPTRAAANDIQLLVGSNQPVAEHRRCGMCVPKQTVVTEHLRHYAERVNDRADARGATDTERASHSRRIAAFQVLSKIRDAGERQFGGLLRCGHPCFSGENYRDAGEPV